jgi:hypothetical protein
MTRWTPDPTFCPTALDGAGIMVLPLVLHDSPIVHAHQGMLLAGMAPSLAPGWWATALHTIGYLGVTMLAAVVVYERVGVGVLRRAWINLDLLWAAALIVTGLITAVI